MLLGIKRGDELSKLTN